MAFTRECPFQFSRRESPQVTASERSVRDSTWPRKVALVIRPSSNLFNLLRKYRLSIAHSMKVDRRWNMGHAGDGGGGSKSSTGAGDLKSVTSCGRARDLINWKH